MSQILSEFILDIFMTEQMHWSRPTNRFGRFFSPNNLQISNSNGVSTSVNALFETEAAEG